MDSGDIDLGTLLRLAASLAAQARARAIAAHGVTVAEWSVLRGLYAGPLPPSELAARIGLTRGAVTRLVDRLRAKRLVVRAKAGSADRRFQTLALTGTGARLVPELTALARAADTATFAALGSRGRSALGGSLRSVVDGLAAADRTGK